MALFEASHDPLTTLTSGLKKEVKGGWMQAHVCVVISEADVAVVMESFRIADSFKSVTNWAYAFRLPSYTAQARIEGFEDSQDDGVGEKILSILQRNSLEGLLMIVSRWQDYGASPGLEVLGTALYGHAAERCKDLIANLKRAMGISEAAPKQQVSIVEESLASEPRVFDFSFLPPVKEPKAPTKFGPNHFLADSAINKSMSLPALFNGGDVRLWMANDECLQNLPEAEIWALRSLRQPDPRIERVLQAVAMLRGQRLAFQPGMQASARWGVLLQVLRSPTVRTELLLFDASQVPLQTAQAVLNILDGLEASDLRRVKAGAGALFEWAKGVALWRCQGPPAEEDFSNRSFSGTSLRSLKPWDAVLDQHTASISVLPKLWPRLPRKRLAPIEVRHIRPPLPVSLK